MYVRSVCVCVCESKGKIGCFLWCESKGKIGCFLWCESKGKIGCFAAIERHRTASFRAKRAVAQLLWQFFHTPVGVVLNFSDKLIIEIIRSTLQNRPLLTPELSPLEHSSLES